MVEIATRVAAQPRSPLSKARVLDTAVALADEGGVDALSMRKIAQALGVVPMALYKHVANKNELLDGMIDLVVGEIDPPATGVGWKAAIRGRVLSARRMLLRHPWAPEVIESRMKARATPTLAVMAYLDSMIGILRAGGLSIDLTHHAMHVMGSRLLGFSQELFEDGAGRDPARGVGGALPAHRRAGRGGLPRRGVRRRLGLRRPVRVRVRPRPDVGRPRAAPRHRLSSP
jgi:AcrR family transcriptional regulator